MPGCAVLAGRRPKAVDALLSVVAPTLGSDDSGVEMRGAAVG